MKIKNIIIFFAVILAFYLPRLFYTIDPSFYESLNLPNYAPKPWLFGVMWTIIYVLQAYLVLYIYNKYDFEEKTRNFYQLFILNYIFNILFAYIFFKNKNFDLAFIDTALVFITSVFLFIETKTIDKKAANLLIPYILWSLFTMILSYSILVLN